MSHKYVYLSDFDLTYVRLDTHPTRTAKHALYDFESYLRSPSYRKGQDFFFDTENGDLSHITEHMVLDTFPELTHVLNRYCFNSKMAIFAPGDSVFALTTQLDRLMRRQLKQPTLVTRFFPDVPLFLNRPDLKLSDLRASAHSSPLIQTS